MFKIFRKNCCGLDVHKTWIYACIGITDKYWIPVFNILEKTCFVTLAHPKYTKPQRGNKTAAKMLNGFVISICATW